MKFNLNFEKAKNIVKKTAITATVSAVSLNSIDGKESTVPESFNKENKNEIKIDNKFTTNNNKMELHFYDAQNEVKENSEDKKLLLQIKQLENNFSKTSIESEMDIGSFSIVSFSDIDNQKFNKEYYRETVNPNVLFTSPLDNNYITNLVSATLFNKVKGIKMKDTDFTGIGEAMKLQDEGYVDYDKGGFVNKRPEYYFAISEKQFNDSTLIFEIKIVKNHKVIDSTIVKEELPDLKLINTKDLESIVNKVIVPDITEAIKDKIKSYNLNVYE